MFAPSTVAETTRTSSIERHTLLDTEYTDRASKQSGPQTLLTAKDLGKDLGSRLASKCLCSPTCVLAHDRVIFEMTSSCVLGMVYDVDTFHLTFFLLPTKHVFV